MSIPEPYPSLEEVLESIGEAGRRLAEIEASEGAAGNISVCLGWPAEVRRKFPLEEQVSLPDPAPELAGRTLLVTGSGRRLRDIHRDPLANLSAVVVEPDGRTARQYTSPNRLFASMTSEFNSHLAVHRDQVQRSGTNFHAVIHAQPPHLTFLSHIPRYREQAYLNRRLLCWQPETIINLPEGIGMLPFMLPGSQELMQANVESLRTHRIVVWSKHGVMARSDISATRASDRIEYAETAARYEYFNLQSGEVAEGLSVEEIQRFCRAFNVPQTIF
jgi:rhamnulose-1-phosphate aldolase